MRCGSPRERFYRLHLGPEGQDLVPYLRRSRGSPEDVRLVLECLATRCRWPIPAGLGLAERTSQGNGDRRQDFRDYYLFRHSQSLTPPHGAEIRIRRADPIHSLPGAAGATLIRWRS